MMRKYSKPEIVTLALDAVDVIETSTTEQVAQAKLNQLNYNNVATIEKNIKDMGNTWSW